MFLLHWNFLKRVKGFNHLLNIFIFILHPSNEDTRNIQTDLTWSFFSEQASLQYPLVIIELWVPENNPKIIAIASLDQTCRPRTPVSCLRQWPVLAESEEAVRNLGGTFVIAFSGLFLLQSTKVYILDIKLKKNLILTVAVFLIHRDI